MTTLIPLWKDFSYFEHQEVGIRWMLTKEKAGTEVSTRDGKGTVTVRGGFQCDDMGLGKTIQIASTMVNHVKKSTLLIAPLAMIETWASVCQRAGMIVYEVVKGQWTKRSSEITSLPKHFMKCRPTVYISNYEKLYHTFKLFDRAWDRVVLDEAHKIRNGDGQVAVYARKINAPIRWVVTGTPLVNSLRDVVSLLAFIGVPYSPIWFWEEKRYSVILPQLLLHRTLHSLRAVIKGAPPVPEIHEDVLPFTTEEEGEFYHGVQGASESMIKKYSGDLVSQVEIFKLLLRLRQISVHPQIYIDAKRREDHLYNRKNWNAPSTKLTRIQSIMKEDTKETHKYIIFCQFIDEMSLIREFLLSQSLAKDENILLYHGGMNQAERTKVLEHSKQTTETTVMLLQLQAGGVGLNLQEYDRIIFVSPWWTSALMDQAIARAVRMGQTKVVKVYHLRLQSEESDSIINIDSMVNGKAAEKRKMLENLFKRCEQEQEQ